MHKMFLYILAILHKVSKVVETFTCVQRNINQFPHKGFAALEMYKEVVAKTACHKATVLGIYFLHKNLLYLAFMNLCATS